MKSEMSQICSTCLSRGRVLVSLNKNKYGSLFGLKAVMRVEYVCWECNATFRRLHQFKLQVLKAQKYLEKSNKVTDLKSLSHIKHSKTIKIDVCCAPIVNKLSEDKLTDEIKPDILEEDIIKSETVFIDALSTAELNLCLQNYVRTGDGVKPNELIPADTPVIKNENEENEEDGVNDDEITIEELRIDNTETLNRNNRHQFKDINLKTTNIANESSNEWRRNFFTSAVLTKDNYIVIKMSEEELQAQREVDRQSHRYKNLCKYKCELCIAGFFDKDTYEIHMKNKHSEKAGNHQCPVCETRFTRLNYYKEHLETHYWKYKCKSCSYVGYKLTEMASHEAREHGVQRFTCRICSKEFPSRSSLRFHRDTIHMGPVKCELCGKMFKTKNNLRVHNKVVHDFVPKTQCPICGAMFRHIRVHMRKHDAAPEAAYCAECDKRFSSVAVYKSHLKFASVHRPPDTLKHHCPICDAKFVNSTSIKKHIIALHSKERPFKCDRCDKGYEAKCKLKLHIKHHHEGVEKPKNNICHICGRGFNTKFMLSNHIRVHTGEKPFRCDICSAAFSQKSSLATHIRGVHLKLKSRPARTRNNSRDLE